jgi:RNA polymerase sigma factor (sigma-70 family)
MTDNRNLLAEYAAGSEPAFRELVDRYLPLVYSTAFRLVSGDAHLAQDISQTVFLDLAREAKSLSTHPQLAGWLHRHTCYVASKTLRSQRRRENRERQAAQMSALEHEPNFSDAAQILDAAINQLNAADRTAILLRFFEGLDFRAIGNAIGANEAAAQKRVSRALEKLHHLLTKRGVTLTAGALAVALTSHAVAAAPVGMAANISCAVLISAPQAASTLSLFQLMAALKSKVALAAVCLTAAVVAPLLVRFQTNQNLANLQTSVAEGSAELAAITAENDVLAARLKAAEDSAARHREETEQLAAEAARLRPDSAEAKRLREQIHELGRRREGGDLTPWQNDDKWRQKQMRTQAWLKAFLDYAAAHDGQLPASFDQADPFFPKPGEKIAFWSNATIDRGATPPAEQYEILYTGSLPALTNVDPNLEIVLFRERKLTPHLHLYDNTNWFKMARQCAMANGFVNFVSTPAGQIDSEFTSYEVEHIASFNPR